LVEKPERKPGVAVTGEAPSPITLEVTDARFLPLGFGSCRSGNFPWIDLAVSQVEGMICRFGLHQESLPMLPPPGIHGFGLFSLEGVSICGPGNEQ